MLQLKKNKSSFWAILVLVAFLSMGGCKAMFIPRCPIKNCKTKMIHLHGGREFRGRPWWKKKQNPKIGELQKDIKHDPEKGRSSPLPKR